jgi:hypothetical protein
MERILVEDPQKMPILGLMVREVLTNRLKDEAIFQKFSVQPVVLVIRAGGMAVTLTISGQGVNIRKGAVEPATVEISGTMKGLLESLSRGPLLGLWHLLQGHLWIKGNPLKLLPLLPLLMNSAGEEKR